MAENHTVKAGVSASMHSRNGLYALPKVVMLSTKSAKLMFIGQARPRGGENLSGRRKAG
jgi:hypothetical protein